MKMQEWGRKENNIGSSHGCLDDIIAKMILVCCS